MELFLAKTNPDVRIVVPHSMDMVDVGEVYDVVIDVDGC